MAQHIRVFESDNDLTVAKEILTKHGIKFSEAPKPERLPGNASKGIVYDIVYGVSIQNILLENNIQNKCFKMSMLF